MRADEKTSFSCCLPRSLSLSLFGTLACTAKKKVNRLTTKTTNLMRRRRVCRRLNLLIIIVLNANRRAPRGSGKERHPLVQLVRRLDDHFLMYDNIDLSSFNSTLASSVPLTPTTIDARNKRKEMHLCHTKNPSVRHPRTHTHALRYTHIHTRSINSRRMERPGQLENDSSSRGSKK